MISAPPRGYSQQHFAAVRCRTSLARRGAPFEFAQALILIPRLHRQAIVETLEFAGQTDQRLVGLLELAVNLLDEGAGRRGNFLAHALRDCRQFAGEIFARGDQLFTQRFTRRSYLALELRAGSSRSRRELFGYTLADAHRRGLRSLRQSLAQRAELLAKLNPRGAEHLAEPDHLGAQIGASQRVSFAILGDPIGDKPHLAANLGKLADHFTAHGVELTAEAGHRLQHNLEARAELFE